MSRAYFIIFDEENKNSTGIASAALSNMPLK